MSNEKPSFDDLKLPSSIVDLSKALTKEFAVGEGNLINPDKEMIGRVLGEDAVKVLAEADKIYSDLTSASAVALTNVSVPYLKKNKSVERIELSLPVGKSKLEAIFDRTKSIRNPMAGSEPTTRYGNLNMSLTLNGTVNQRGHLKKIRAWASDLTAHELAK